MGQRYEELIKARQLASAFVGPDNKIIDPGANNTRDWSTYESKSFNHGQSSNPDRDYKFQCTQCSRAFNRPYRAENHLIKGKIW